ncbi:uncharacterized protein KRP23_1677 [Phytophthora ramorum]|uniref:uncharacterized protein n=1 Tax=Phytophthora ramorum TaxID=164328 RepID=UPI0030B4CC7A|nr:hypothetical protein KRP23_1677 [Phytophthora ramorum]
MICALKGDLNLTAIVLSRLGLIAGQLCLPCETITVFQLFVALTGYAVGLAFETVDLSSLPIGELTKPSDRIRWLPTRIGMLLQTDDFILETRYLFLLAFAGSEVLSRSEKGRLHVLLVAESRIPSLPSIAKLRRQPGNAVGETANLTTELIWGRSSGRRRGRPRKDDRVMPLGGNDYVQEAVVVKCSPEM